MAISLVKIEFIRENSGTISCREMAKILGISHSSVFRYTKDEKEPRVLKTKKPNNKGYSQKSYLKHRVDRIAKMKEIYDDKKRSVDARTWQQRVEDGIESYHFVMRRHKLPRKMVYLRLRRDFEDIQRMKKAA